MTRKNYKYLGDENFYIKILSGSENLEVMPFCTPVMLIKDIVSALDMKGRFEETLLNKDGGTEEKYAIGIKNIATEPIFAEVIFIIPN